MTSPGRMLAAYVLVEVELGEQHQADGGEHHAGEDRDLRSDAGNESGEAGGRGHDAEDHRGEGEAGLQRRVAQRQRDVVGQEQEDREQSEADDGDGEERSAARAVPDDVQREQRVLDAALDHGEHGEQSQAGTDADQRGGAGPTVGLGVGETVDERHQAGDDDGGAGDVELGRVLVAGLLLEHQDCADDRDDGDRHVDVQAPAPGEVFRQGAAEHQADGATTAGDRAEDRERLGALGGVGERHGQQRQGGGREERAEDALCDARARRASRSSAQHPRWPRRRRSRSGRR